MPTLGALVTRLSLGGRELLFLDDATRAAIDADPEAVDPKASQAAGHDVRVRVRPWSTPAYWAAWQLWGLPE